MMLVDCTHIDPYRSINFAALPLDLCMNIHQEPCLLGVWKGKRLWTEKKTFENCEGKAFAKSSYQKNKHCLQPTVGG